MAMLLAVILLCSGCSAEKEPQKVSEVGFYLDTVITHRWKFLMIRQPSFAARQGSAK